MVEMLLNCQFVQSSYATELYLPLVITRLGEASGQLKDVYGEELAFEEAMEAWIKGFETAPSEGWIYGGRFEAKMSSQRLQEIADQSKKPSKPIEVARKPAI